MEVNLKKILIFAGVGLLLFFLTTEPTEAATTVTNILSMLEDAAQSLVTFVKAIT